MGVSISQPECLWSSVFIVDTWDKDVNEGDIVTFTVFFDNPYYEKGEQFTKMLIAKGGDMVVVTKDEVIVNSERVYPINASNILKALGKTESDLSSPVIVPPEHYFMLGETPYSWDSRFWGVVPKSEVVGKTYAIY